MVEQICDSRSDGACIVEVMRVVVWGSDWLAEAIRVVVGGRRFVILGVVMLKRYGF